MYIQCFIDGAARNQGTELDNDAACAVVIYKSGKEIVRFVRGLGNRNNNEAEFEALISCLLICSMANLPSPTIYSDSAVVVNHTNAKWECRTPSLLPYIMTIKEIKQQYSFQLLQVPRAKVHVPDTLCHLFLDKLEHEKKRLKI